MNDQKTHAAHSKHPDILSWWTDIEITDLDWQARCDSLIDEIRPFPDAKGMTLTGFGTVFGGFAYGSSSPEIPLGWRLDRKHSMLVPLRSTAKGKAIAAKIKALGRLDDARMHVPGIPTDLFNGSGLVMVDGEVWVQFRHPRSDIDLDLWTPAKLSEWYAASERSATSK